MTRVTSAQKIAAARAEGRPALIGYLPAGYPDVATSIEAAVALAENGVDVIEIGIPYSDPVMDGQVIQEATVQALANGFKVPQIFEIVRDLNQRERVSFLLAEQNTNIALRYADYGYILENGRVMMDGAAAELAQNEDVKEFYLGISSGERKSFRDQKFYRRRKRWLA